MTKGSTRLWLTERRQQNKKPWDREVSGFWVIRYWLYGT